MIVQTYNKLLYFLLAVIAIPLVLYKLNIHFGEGLHGSSEKSEIAKFSFQSWFSGDYATLKQKNIEDNLCFRNFFVRVGNSIDYKFFNQSHTKNVVIGKSQCLFEQAYIDAYVGKDYLGFDSLVKLIDVIKNVQDSFQARQKQLITIIAPGKASFFPEYIPTKYKGNMDSTNTKVFSSLALLKNVNLIDFNSWFNQLKNKTPYPLYSHGGIHWTNYGMLIATDSLLRYIEHIRIQSLPQLKWSNPRLEAANESDNDILLSCNLLYNPYPETLAYHDIEFVKDKNGIMLNSVMIADSYHWGLMSLGISNAFKRHEFWYYNTEKHSAAFKSPESVEKKKILQDLLNSDVVLVMSTEGNMAKIGWGVFQTAYEQFHQSNEKSISDEDYAIKLRNLINYIKTDKKWLDDINRKAKENNISLDSMISLDATWLLDQEVKK